MKMYVLLRSDLHPTYTGVQAGHALAKYLLTYTDEAYEWGNQYLIYLNGGTLISMQEALFKINMSGYNYTVFREPDIDNQLTAIAVYCDGFIFKDFKLF